MSTTTHSTSTRLGLIHSELRKLTTTRMPLAFIAVLVAIAVTNGVAVAVGTDMDGSKSFISTGLDQQSLIGFAANALMLGGLFGATAASREYAHNTAIGMYLVTPHRPRALGAHLTAVASGGAVLGVLGTAFTSFALAMTLPLTDFEFMVSLGGLAQVHAAAAWAGAAGAVLGAAIGTIVRNTGGAVTGAVLVLVVAPPVVVQLANATAEWMPGALALAASGVGFETGFDTSAAVAVAVIAIWAIVPAMVALWSVNHRDVV